MTQMTDYLRFGSYENQDLMQLWAILRNSFRTSPLKYDPIGLIEVPFNIPLWRFTGDLAQKIRDHTPSIESFMVSTDLKDVLGFLNRKSVYLHHLSCAGECKSAYNSAIAIHTMAIDPVKRTKKQCYLAVPGINYGPPLETIETWLASDKVSPLEYGRWIEILQRLEASNKLS